MLPAGPGGRDPGKEHDARHLDLTPGGRAAPAVPVRRGPLPGAGAARHPGRDQAGSSPAGLALSSGGRTKLPRPRKVLT